MPIYCVFLYLFGVVFIQGHKIQIYYRVVCTRIDICVNGREHRDHAPFYMKHNSVTTDSIIIE